MIHIRIQPEIRPYLEQPVQTNWVKRIIDGATCYSLELITDRQASGQNAGLREREPEIFATAKFALLESGALLASFPLQEALPGSIHTDPYSVWFRLDAPLLVPPGIFGQEVRIDPGLHLMTLSLGSWVVFFKPLLRHRNVLRSPGPFVRET